MDKIISAEGTELRIGLFDPGMTNILRAGLGGLAAAVRAIGEDKLGAVGSIKIGRTDVALNWKLSGSASTFFERLFTEAFKLTDGLIDLPGSYTGDPTPDLRSAMNSALRLTFLQHGSSAKKSGTVVRSFELDEKLYPVQVDAYKEYVHQKAWKDIAKVLDAPSSKATGVKLAGWANPGAVERHVGLGGSEIVYTPGEALCACFALVGCLSLLGPNRTGVLLVPEPNDLLAFARTRPRLAPRRLSDCFVASSGDGALWVHAALPAASIEEDEAGVAGVSAMILRSTSWASQQKSRTEVLPAQRYDLGTLAAFSTLMRCCPPRVVARKAKGARDAGGYWGIPSSLRGFVADNLAAGRPFFAGFARARNGDNPPRWLHRYYTAEDNLGALRFPDDKKGIISMIETLAQAERLLVDSVHAALRSRFGAISGENAQSPTARRNRIRSERDKWRLAFANARTHQQVRFALADLWSRAGIVRELQGPGWRTLLPLLQAEDWETLRDLALIALASYQGKNDDDVSEEASEGDEP